MGGFSAPFPKVPISGGVITQNPILETGTTNFCLFSAAFSNAAWVQSGGITVTPNIAVPEAPNNIAEADQLIGVAAINSAVTQAVAHAGDNNAYCASVYAAPQAAFQNLRLQVTLITTGEIYFFDMDVQGRIVNQSANVIAGFDCTIETSYIEDSNFIFNNTWYRMQLRFRNNPANAGGFSFALICLAGVGLSVASYGVWGAQIERVPLAAGFPNYAPVKATTQIPTVGASVARVADKIPAWLLDTAGITAAIITTINSTPRQQIFTGNGNFNVPAGVTQIFLTGAAGGGGGGGSAATGAGGGGGGGQSCIKQAVVVTPLQVIAITIGTGGAGGVAGNNNGVIGVNTVFNSTAVVTLLGGNPGGGAAAAADGNGGLLGGAGAGNGNGGQIQIGYGGMGGGNQLSSVQLNALTSFGNGSNGVLYGGGGTGGGTSGGTGGNGAAGIVIVEW